jgi:hypothetical protein
MKTQKFKIFKRYIESDLESIKYYSVSETLVAIDIPLNCEKCGTYYGLSGHRMCDSYFTQKCDCIRLSKYNDVWMFRIKSSMELDKNRKCRKQK